MGRCETDQTMDVRKALLLQAEEKRSGGGAEEWRRVCDNLKLLKSLVFCNSGFLLFFFFFSTPGKFSVKKQNSIYLSYYHYYHYH